MWKTELGTKVPAKFLKEKKLVGSKEAWYEKCNEYWDVLL